MRMQKMISGGFAVLAVASVSIPAVAFMPYPDVDFGWYATVGKSRAPTVELIPAPREGYIYVPGRWQTRGTGQVWTAGHWMQDDYARQIVVYNNPDGSTTFATGPLTLYDKDGNVIPTNPDAYPVR